MTNDIIRVIISETPALTVLKNATHSALKALLLHFRGTGILWLLNKGGAKKGTSLEEPPPLCVTLCLSPRYSPSPGGDFSEVSG